MSNEPKLPGLIPIELRSVTAPNGTQAFGYFPPEVMVSEKMPSADIRLLNGFDNGKHNGFGFRHIESYASRRKLAMDKLGFRSLDRMIYFVTKDYDCVCIGQDGRYLLYKKFSARLWIKVVIDWSDERDCWHVVTALPTATNRDKAIWEKDAD